MKSQIALISFSILIAIVSQAADGVGNNSLSRSLTIRKDAYCRMNIDGTGKDPVRNCAQRRAQSLVYEACSDLGGEVTTINSSNTGVCHPAGDLISECEATAKGLCSISEETKQAQRDQEQKAREAAKLEAQQAERDEALRAQLNQKKQENTGNWLNYAKNVGTVCEFISKQRPVAADDCRKLQSSVQLTESGARIVMAAAINNVYVGLDAIKAADKKEFAPVAQSICMTISLSNAAFGVECIKASAGKTYTESDANQCSSIIKRDRRAIYNSIECLQATGKHL